MLDPNDSLQEYAVVVTFIDDKLGAGSGASAFKTSLNLSTAVPTLVPVVKSANRPSV